MIIPIDFFCGKIYYLIGFKMLFFNYIFVKKARYFLNLTFFSKFDLKAFSLIFYTIS